MTPEQKAFYEYGELFQLWKDARRCVFWHEESHEDIRREIVQKVWQKRAACRVLKATGGRCCSNCLYKNLPGSRRPCAMCEDVTHWEPRKEGE